MYIMVLVCHTSIFARYEYRASSDDCKAVIDNPEILFNNESTISFLICTILMLNLTLNVFLRALAHSGCPVL